MWRSCMSNMNTQRLIQSYHIGKVWCWEFAWLIWVTFLSPCSMSHDVVVGGVRQWDVKIHAYRCLGVNWAWLLLLMLSDTPLTLCSHSAKKSSVESQKGVTHRLLNSFIPVCFIQEKAGYHTQWINDITHSSAFLILNHYTTNTYFLPGTVM